jgi:dihydropyrimidinase
MLRGGRIVTAHDEYVADVYIDDGKIRAIGTDLDVGAELVIDAAGRYLLPGGVDPHTHIEDDFGGTTSCDDFTSGTVSAAFGGTTTIVDFCQQAPGQSLMHALGAWQEKLDRAKPVIDVGAHIAVTDLESGGSIAELAHLPDVGVTSYKLFMAYKGAIMVDDGTLFTAMQVARRTGALVLVHAENGDVIDVLVRQALAEGHNGPAWHGHTRPPELEGEATNRAIQLAHLAGVPLYVVHMSCLEALIPLADARAQGWPVMGETCTQYLFIDDTSLSKPNFEGAKYVYTPPPREKQHLEGLWRALSNRTLDVVATDHCPFNWTSQKTLGLDNFSKIPNGAPGVEDRLMMLHQFGVRSGRISLRRLVELTAYNPARIFGLYPKKGTIAVGSDADVVVFNPQVRATISAKTHHSRVDYNLYEGVEVEGVPEIVLVRGEIIVREGELIASPGTGRFVQRARFDSLLY